MFEVFFVYVMVLKGQIEWGLAGNNLTLLQNYIYKMNGNVYLVRIVGFFWLFFLHHNLWMAWDKSWMVLRELLSVAVSISCLSAFFCKVVSRQHHEQKTVFLVDGCRRRAAAGQNTYFD